MRPRVSGDDVSKAPVNFGVSENRRVARPGEVARSAVPVQHFTLDVSFIHSLSTTRGNDGVVGFGARARASRRATRSGSRDRARASPPRARAASSSSSDRDGAAKEGPVVVAVVTTASCPHCRRAKAAIAAAGIAFEEIDASAPDGVVLDAARKLSGMRTVPQVFVGGVCYGGADDVEAGIADGDFPAAVASAARARE